MMATELSRQYAPILGTHGALDQRPWNRAGSMFDKAMSHEGVHRVGRTRRFWSTALGGLFLQGLVGSDHLVWQFGGEEFAEAVREDFGECELLIVAHSWGGLVALYALAELAEGEARDRFDLWTVDTPIRLFERRMHSVYRRALPAIRYHVHTYSCSATRFLGRGFRQSWEGDTKATSIYQRGGHSGILEDSEFITQVSKALKQFPLRSGTTGQSLPPGTDDSPAASD